MALVCLFAYYVMRKPPSCQVRFVEFPLTVPVRKALNPTMEHAEQSLGRALSAEVQRRGITRAEAARLLGTSGANVTRWMNGTQIPSPAQHSALQEFLGVDRPELALLVLTANEELWAQRHD
jgi:hypothetical protein